MSTGNAHGWGWDSVVNPPTYIVSVTHQGCIRSFVGLRLHEVLIHPTLRCPGALWKGKEVVWWWLWGGLDRWAFLGGLTVSSGSHNGRFPTRAVSRRYSKLSLWPGDENHWSNGVPWCSANLLAFCDGDRQIASSDLWHLNGKGTHPVVGAKKLPLRGGAVRQGSSHKSLTP